MNEEKSTNAGDVEQIRLYDLKELETLLGVSGRSLLTYIKEGKLKAVRIGRKWRVSSENVRKFINGE